MKPKHQKTPAETRRANRGNLPGHLGMAELAMLMPQRSHLWTSPNQIVKWEHCGTCGVIKRTDGLNGPCKGTAPRVEFR